MAKRFEFNLEPVLSVRTIEQENRKRAFAEATARVQEQSRTIDGIERDRHEARDAFALSRAGSVGMLQLRLEEGYLLGLERRLRREGAELVKRLQVREARRVDYVEARRKVRLLEKLRQKRLEGWKGELEREEQKLLDEVASVQHRRREEVPA